MPTMTRQEDPSSEGMWCVNDSDEAGSPRSCSLTHCLNYQSDCARSRRDLQNEFESARRQTEMEFRNYSRSFMDKMPVFPDSDTMMHSRREQQLAMRKDFSCLVALQVSEQAFA